MLLHAEFQEWFSAVTGCAEIWFQGLPTIPSGIQEASNGRGNAKVYVLCKRNWLILERQSNSFYCKLIYTYRYKLHCKSCIKQFHRIGKKTNWSWVRMKPFKDEDYYSRIQVKNIRVFFLNLKMTDFQLSVKSLQSVPMHHQNNKNQTMITKLNPQI